MDNVKQLESDYDRLNDKATDIELSISELKSKQGIKGVDHTDLNNKLDELTQARLDTDNQLRRLHSNIAKAKAHAAYEADKVKSLADSEALLKAKLRASYPGNDTQFANQWPSIRDAYYAQKAIDDSDSNPIVRELRTKPQYTSFL